MKRLIRIVGGFLLLIAGIAMLALPGPGWLTIALGLALLASDFRWAAHLLDRLKQAGGKLNPVKRRPPTSCGEPDARS